MTGNEIGDREYEHVPMVCNKFEIKTVKDYHDVYFKMWCFIVNWCVWKI